ncbi:MAG: hypothetical protein QNJ63_00455 [Calothrix sp. MO_192.B10]|nr:hypothetical protein [Calothrix sp. MO_192.B10]
MLSPGAAQGAMFLRNRRGRDRIFREGGNSPLSKLFQHQQQAAWGEIPTLLSGQLPFAGV